LVLVVVSKVDLLEENKLEEVFPAEINRPVGLVVLSTTTTVVSAVESVLLPEIVALINPVRLRIIFPVAIGIDRILLGKKRGQ